MSDSQTPPTNETPEEVQNEALQSLVMEVYKYRNGVEITSIPMEQREQAIRDSLKFILQYVEKYIKDKFGEKHAVQFKAQTIYDSFAKENKWPFVDDEMNEALQDLVFVLLIKNHPKEKDEILKKINEIE